MNAPSILYRPDTTVPANQVVKYERRRTWSDDGDAGQPSQHLSVTANRRSSLRATGSHGQLQTLKKVRCEKERDENKNGGHGSKKRKAKKSPHQEPAEEDECWPRYTLQACSDMFDPFSAMPIQLNRFQEHLISFYLYHYPHATYGFSIRLRPHPVATNFKIALNNPACFQVILARSAMYRTSLQTYSSEKEKNALELAMLRHKVEAIRCVHKTSVEYNRSKEPKAKDDLLASIMSLGNLDRRSGSVKSADMHYTAIRRILKATGGPLAIQSPMLNRVSVFFECIYGTSPNSYIWDNSDVAGLLTGANGFFQSVRKVWLGSPTTDENKAKSALRAIHQTCYLKPKSTLHSFLSRGPQEETAVSHPARLELIWQLTTLLTLAALVVDLHDRPDVLQSYMDTIYKGVEDLQLTALDASNNIMWLTQITDSSEEHTKRILRVAGWAWVCKHLNFNMQVKLKNWLLQFLNGGKVADAFRLDTFNFSYAS